MYWLCSSSLWTSGHHPHKPAQTDRKGGRKAASAVPRAASHRSRVSCFASVFQTSLSRAAASGSRRWASRFWRPRRASTKSVSLRCERSAIRCRTRGGSNPARRSVRPARPPARPSVACTNHASSFLEVGSASATGGAGAAEGACQTRGRGAGCAAGGVWSPCARQWRAVLSYLCYGLYDKGFFMKGFS